MTMSELRTDPSGGAVLLMFDCINCGAPAVANPRLVLSIRCRRDEHGQMVPDRTAPREPVCRACAERALVRIATEPTLEYDPIIMEPDYLSRAYSTGAPEGDL